VLFFQAAEIEVGKNVAQQDQAAITIFLEHTQSFARPAHVCAEVHVRQDQRVIDLRVHSSIVSQDCYEVMNWEPGQDEG